MTRDCTASSCWQASDIHREMIHLERLESLGLWKLLKRNKPLAVNALFFFAVVQNVLLGLRYSVPGVDGTGGGVGTARPKEPRMKLTRPDGPG